MNPDLVLNEEQKNHRFRSSYSLTCGNIKTDCEEAKSIIAPTLASEENSVQFVRVPVIQRNREETSPPDREILHQKELDLVLNYLHKKFRRRNKDELISRSVLN